MRAHPWAEQDNIFTGIGIGLLHRIIAHPSFALIDLFLVMASGAIWILRPEVGVWVILVAALPWVLRVLVGEFPFRRTSFDWLVAIFLATAWAGWWAAYDRESAWLKVWLIVLSVLLFYALAGQPREHLIWICAGLFCVGLGISIYFFMTHDFVTLPRKVEIVNRVGRGLMEIRPNFGWSPIHPNYVAGMVVITTPFILFPVTKLIKRRDSFSFVLGSLIVAGLGLTGLAIIAATSRGIVLAVVSAAGVWAISRILSLKGISRRFHKEAVFPALVLGWLCVVILLLYAGPAKSGNVFSDHYYFGSGSRSELFSRSLYLIGDFPFTGGGLASFPGLYSLYMLGIPFFNVPNSHNLFLDVAIEQGPLGGIAVLAIFLISIWIMAKTIAVTHPSEMQTFNWILFLALIVAFIHGLVDDYLYNGNGTLLVLMLAGLSVSAQSKTKISSQPIKLRVVGVASSVFVALILLNLNGIRSAWYANLGAVEMAKVELSGFPTNQWTDQSALPKLQQADTWFQTALQADPTNRTANHRLGLIYTLRRDFPSALHYLEQAHQRSDHHRGILKSLGYCYVWSGNLEKASLFLRQIPEADSELDAYAWWWETEGRYDLSQNASLTLQILGSGVAR